MQTVSQVNFSTIINITTSNLLTHLSQTLFIESAEKLEIQQQLQI